MNTKAFDKVKFEELQFFSKILTKLLYSKQLFLVLSVKLGEPVISQPDVDDSLFTYDISKWDSSYWGRLAEHLFYFEECLVNVETHPNYDAEAVIVGGISYSTFLNGLRKQVALLTEKVHSRK